MAAPIRGGNFARKCISTTRIGAPIYIWPRAAIPPCSATGSLNPDHRKKYSDLHLSNRNLEVISSRQTKPAPVIK